jgi:hypothetical protein
MEILLDTMKQAIRDSGISRRQIALGTDISESQLCLVMQGKRGITVGKVERILLFLGYSIEITPPESEVE